MNSKRRAELQRKLTLNAVPRPPAGLSERIKADIPKYLEPESTGSRFTRTMGIPMRVAAAILLLVTSTVIGVNYLQNGAKQESVATPVVFAPAARAMRDTAAAAPTEEVHLEIAQEAESVAVPQLAATNVAPSPVVQRRERRADAAQFDEEMKVESAATGGIEGGVASAASAPRQIAEAMPAPPPPPAAPPVAAAPASAGATMDRAISVTAEAPTIGFVSEAHAAKLSLDRKTSVFGISVDPRVFEEIRATLENGGRPLMTDVDVEALVNYFAGQPSNRPRERVRFDVEASPAAVEAHGDHAVLRFSVDTPAATAPGSVPPIATDARIEIDFNEQAVSNAKRIGNDDTLKNEPVLLYGTSVTGLYALELRPNLKSSTLVASVTLHYRSVADGNRHTIKRTVLGRDLARSWTSSTRRHRLASLGAVWGETLRGTSAAGFDLARRAEELATQDPKNPRAKELAAAASASTGGGGGK